MVQVGSDKNDSSGVTDLGVHKNVPKSYQKKKEGKFNEVELNTSKGVDSPDLPVDEYHTTQIKTEDEIEISYEDIKTENCGVCNRTKCNCPEQTVSELSGLSCEDISQDLKPSSVQLETVDRQESKCLSPIDSICTREVEMVCRICLQLVTSSCSEPVEDITKEVLKVLLIDVDWRLSEKPVICFQCKKRICEFSDFKVMCINTEALLKPYLARKTIGEVDLNSVYLDSVISKEGVCGSQMEILKICRLCMKSKQCEYYSFSIDALAAVGIEETFLRTFLGGLSLGATKSPIICQSCLRLFVNFAKFIKSWSRIERKIVGYYNMTRMAAESRINLCRIARFIKSVTPELISSDEQEDFRFLRRVDGRENEESIKTRAKLKGQLHAIWKKTARKKPEEDTKQQADERKRAGQLKKGRKPDTHKKAAKERQPVGKRKEPSAKQCLTEKKTRPLKTRTVEEDQRQLVQKELAEEKMRVSPSSPRCLLTPVRRELKVVIEKLEITTAKALPSTSTGRKTHSCPRCDFTSIYKQCIVKHFARKHQVMSCADCSFTTTSKNRLKVHITKSHRTFRCSFCPLTCMTLTGKRIHMSTKHAETSKLFKCQRCDFETKYQTNLRKHAEVHSERNAKYQCGSCSYSSNFRNNLRRHAIVHLEPEEGQIFKCYQCPFETKRKDDLRHHIEFIHLDITDLFRCPKCPFKTKYKVSFANHSERHDNVVYRCEKCIFRTVNSEAWKRHCRKDEHS